MYEQFYRPDFPSHQTVHCKHSYVSDQLQSLSILPDFTDQFGFSWGLPSFTQETDGIQVVYWITKFDWATENRHNESHVNGEAISNLIPGEDNLL